MSFLWPVVTGDYWVSPFHAITAPVYFVLTESERGRSTVDEGEENLRGGMLIRCERQIFITPSKSSTRHGLAHHTQPWGKTEKYQYPPLSNNNNNVVLLMNEIAE